MKTGGQVEAQLDIFRLQLQGHSSSCPQCHKISEHGKTEEYCIQAEGIRYWICALEWVLK